MLDNLNIVDIGIFYLIHNWRNSFLDFLLPIFSETWLLIIFVLAFLLLLKKHYSWFELLVLAFAIILGIALANTCCDIIKELSGRLRPYQQLLNVYYLSDGAWKQTTIQDIANVSSRGSSFCSAHVANTTAVIMTIILLVRRTWVYALFAIPFMVAWSRIYLGKHFFFDTFVGYIVGVICAVIVYFIILWLISLKSKTKRSEA